MVINAMIGHTRIMLLRTAPSGTHTWIGDEWLGFGKATPEAETEMHGFVFTPGRYAGAEEQEGDGEPIAEKLPRLVMELEE